MGSIFLTSPTEKINNTDTIYLWMEFKNSPTNMSVKFSDANIGIKVAKWGTLGISYDLTDSLISTAQYTLTLQERFSFLYDLFFSPAGEQEVEAVIQLYVNNSLEFEGSVIADTIDYNHGTKEITFTCAPKMDILNKLKLTDDNGAPINPAGFPVSGMEWMDDHLLKIFQTVDPYIESVNIKSDWIFTSFPEMLPVISYTFSELRVHGQICVNYGIAAEAGCSSLADYLKQLCVNYASIAGMLSSKKPFFKKMIFNTSNERQYAGKELSKHTFYKTQKYEYVKVVANTPDSNIKGTATAGNSALAQIEGQSFELGIWETFFEYDPPGSSHFLGGMKRSDSASKQIFGVADPHFLNGTIYTSMNQFLADFWYNIRHNTQNLKFIKGSMVGISYDFVKDLVLKSREIVQLTSLVKNYSVGTTAYEGIYIGMEDV